jgi:hypothetical protein
MTARLQHQPASSRGTATALMVGRLPALVEHSPAAVKAAAGLVGAGAHRRGLSVPALLELAAGPPQRPAVVPGSLDQQAPRVRVAGLRDRALAAAHAGRRLARDEAEVGADRTGSAQIFVDGMTGLSEGPVRLAP